MRALLEAAQQEAPEILPMLALGAFAGQSGMPKLNDSIGVRLILCAATLKSKPRRPNPQGEGLSSLQPNLVEWLRPHIGKTGRVVSQGDPEQP